MAQPFPSTAYRNCLPRSGPPYRRPGGRARGFESLTPLPVGDGRRSYESTNMPETVATSTAPNPAEAFRQHLLAAVAIARAADFPADYGDALQRAAEAVWREARKVH